MWCSVDKLEWKKIEEGLRNEEASVEPFNLQKCIEGISGTMNR